MRFCCPAFVQADLGFTSAIAMLMARWVASIAFVYLRRFARSEEEVS